MKRKVLFILLLLFLNLIGYLYLNNLIINKKTYKYHYLNNPLVINTQEVLLNSIDEFNFDNYFKVIYYDNYYLNSKLEENIIYVNLIINEKQYDYQFSYSLIEPEIIEVIKEVIVEKEVVKEVETSNDYNYEVIVEEDYFDGYHDLTYQKGVDINEIVKDLMKDIKTNKQVSIDYAYLNPNSIGDYPVYYITKDEEICIFVHII